MISHDSLKLTYIVLFYSDIPSYITHNFFSKVRNLG